MMIRRILRSSLLMPCLFIPGLVLATDVQTGTDPDAQLPYWELRNPEMRLRLVQRLPDQSRAFFLARGFSSEHVELIARSCVFQTVFKNTSNLTTPSPLGYHLHDWTIHYKGTQRKMKVREDWKQEWQKRGVPMAAQLAFEWALYPTEQVYQPGDYNWGMSVFNLEPGSVFDLDVVWHQSGKQHTGTIKGIECAADVTLAPRGSE